VGHTVTGGHKYRDLGLDARLMTLLCTNTVARSKVVKTGCNLAESSKESYGSRRADFLMMMVLCWQ
jgi:hypothetical protein